jgi:hypothetical protein
MSEYFIVPWSLGTTVFANLVFFPALLWSRMLIIIIEPLRNITIYN